jgi:hypothetical protein
MKSLELFGLAKTIVIKRDANSKHRRRCNLLSDC